MVSASDVILRAASLCSENHVNREVPCAIIARKCDKAALRCGAELLQLGAAPWEPPERAGAALELAPLLPPLAETLAPPPLEEPAPPLCADPDAEEGADGEGPEAPTAAGAAPPKGGTPAPAIGGTGGGLSARSLCKAAL